jgi:hypothetical protein
MPLQERRLQVNGLAEGPQNVVQVDLADRSHRTRLRIQQRVGNVSQ